jgi:hypothetical protein
MREEAVYAYRFNGKRYDCGSKLGYLQATVEYALGHPALGKEFRKYLEALDPGTVAAQDDIAPRRRTSETAEARPNGNGHGRAVNGNGAGTHGRGAGRRKGTGRRASAGEAS